MRVIPGHGRVIINHGVSTFPVQGDYDEVFQQHFNLSQQKC